MKHALGDSIALLSEEKLFLYRAGVCRSHFLGKVMGIHAFLTFDRYCITNCVFFVWI